MSMIQIGAYQIQWIVAAALVFWFIYRRFLQTSSFGNVPGPPPSGNWTKGHLAQLFDRRGWDFLHGINSKYGPVVKLDGFLGGSWLFVYDPVALHNIIVKDQHIFEESGPFITLNRLMFGKGLLGTLGEHHRKQRKMLNPVFSINHMRHMLPIFYQVTDRLRDAITHELADGSKNIDLLEWTSRTALELVGQGGLGYSLDALTDDTPNPFGEAMKSLGPTLFPMVMFRLLSPVLCKLGPAGFRRWVVQHTPYWRAQKLKNIIDSMHMTACKIFEAKKDALEKGEEAVVQQVGEGKDIMSRLLLANMAASEEDRLPDDEVIAQMSTLVFAAMDTTSSALARILHLLAQHPQVQDKLREEIVRAKQVNGESVHLSYDELHALPYLEAVCRETLRLYPPLMNLTKTARQDVILPLSKPIRGRDGTLIHEIPIPKDTSVVVGILASNRNPALWGSDSDEWKPERWLAPLPDAVIKARIPGVYSNLMTFLGGGRACIGFKFSQMEMKVVLCTLLENFKLSPATDLKDEVVWNVAGIQYPSLGFESDKPQLPLRVERLGK